jgi:hypothetical protein
LIPKLKKIEEIQELEVDLEEILDSEVEEILELDLEVIDKSNNG